MSDLRPEGHDTRGCFPVYGSVVHNNATAYGDAVNVVRRTSPLNIGEENITRVSGEIYF